MQSTSNASRSVDVDFFGAGAARDGAALGCCFFGWSMTAYAPGARGN
uniref:Uncharacterized protein n=1 Tax=Triticum urartu TaxID=4572 RepID=A0A8R7V253_TRIUA